MSRTINLTEMNKLEEYLKEKDISYTRVDEEGHWDNDLKTQLGVRHQIRFYLDDNNSEQSIVCHPYTYGYEYGLLEGLGSLFVRGDDDITGWLTAYDVIDRIENPSKYELAKIESHIQLSIDNLQDTIKDIFTETKTYIDFLITEIQEDKISLDKVKEELERLSKVLSMD